MSEKRYTSRDMREVERDLCVLRCPQVEVARRMLRQAADTEEEMAQLKARLEAVVKELEDMRKYCAFACVDPEDVDAILRAARGEGGAE